MYNCDMNVPYRKWSYLLRGLGFTMDWNSVAGGCRVTEFIKQFDERRKVAVQIWATGSHRASHSFHGCSDTKPTDFTTIEGMLAAIKHESIRKDGKYSVAGSCVADRISLLPEMPSDHADHSAERTHSAD